jgi:uncharacterized protein (DUF1810 family)
VAGLERFVEAQRPIHDQALGELRAGAKRSHWMWFVFPQIAGLGRSPTARRYALRDAVEARAYLTHPVLGARLRECTEAMLGWAGRKSAEVILGPVDAKKFASSMTFVRRRVGHARQPVRPRLGRLQPRRARSADAGAAMTPTCPPAPSPPPARVPWRR